MTFTPLVSIHVRKIHTFTRICHFSVIPKEQGDIYQPTTIRWKAKSFLYPGSFSSDIFLSEISFKMTECYTNVPCHCCCKHFEVFPECIQGSILWRPPKLKGVKKAWKFLSEFIEDEAGTLFPLKTMGWTVRMVMLINGRWNKTLFSFTSRKCWRREGSLKQKDRSYYLYLTQL